MPRSSSFASRAVRFGVSMLAEIASMLNVFAWFARWPKFPLERLDEARAFYERHGWAIVSGVFSEAEVASLRADALRSKADGFEGDLLADPQLGGERFVLHPNLLRIVRTIVPGQPVHFGDTSRSIGYQPPAFHKDNPDRLNGSGPDWRSPYTITRFGLYLQDHRTYSGGLALRDGSHQTASLRIGRPFAVPTAPGDIVLWSLRTTHSGFATRLRGLVDAFLPLTVMALLLGDDYRPSKLLFRPLAAEPRIALFASFGVRDHHLDRFLRQLRTRDYAVRQWQATHYSEAVRAALTANGLGLVDMPEETRGVDLSTLSAGFVELPDA